MRPWKPLLALLAISAFLSVVYPLAAFVYASLDGNIEFGVYYSLLGDTLCLSLNVTNNGSVSLEGFSAIVLLNTSFGPKIVNLTVGDVAPGESLSAQKCVRVGDQFEVEEVSFSFKISGMYPLRVKVRGKG